MRVAIATDGEERSSNVAEDIGHAPFFIVVDTDTNECFSIRNEHAGGSHGIGMTVAKELSSLNLDAIIVGGIGPHGYKILIQAGITVASDEEGPAEKALEAFLRRHG